MPVADSFPFLVVIGALAIGAGAGAALGRVVAARAGAGIGAVIGAAGTALYAYVLATGALVSSNTVALTLISLAVLCCGLMAGFFFAFSVLVMKALAQQPSAAGMAAMQAINIVVFNPVFGAAFSGTPVVCVLVMIAALVRWTDPGAGYALVGGLLYLIGTLGVTAVCNVPRNDALAAVEPTRPGAEELWSRYLREWTTWNHVRTMAAFAATAALIIALIRGVGTA